MSITARSLCAVLCGLAALAFARDGGASVVTYPSSTTIYATGPLPPTAGKELSYNVATGERDGAFLVVTAAKSVAVSVAQPQGVTVRLYFAHFVSVGGRVIPDALEPWDGSARPTERANQPVLVQVEVPYGMPAGSIGTTVTVTADGHPTTVPLRIRIFPVALPHAGTRIGNLLTSFLLSPESYVNKTAQLYGFATHEQRIASNNSLFGLLGSYRVSPGSWGFAEPRGPGGYESSSRWWLDSAGNFLSQLGSSPGFSALRIPISSNRTSPGSYIAGLKPQEPETWCGYLRNVHGFWMQHKVLRPDAVPFVFGVDEPGPEGQRLVARQAAAVHACFPGGRQLMTGNPSQANSFLWDGKRGDDLDIWTVLSRRYYGTWTPTRQARAGKSRARDYLRAIDRVRARGKMVWTYTYTGTRGTPGFAATEPLSNPRMLLLWTALEGIEGVLYTQGATSYTKASPFQTIGTGEKVLLYPGPHGPWPSARLEQIRDGIEDWAIYNMVRVRRGSGAVRAILGEAGLFSASRAGVRLACNQNCEVKSATKYAWPLWSRDPSTPRRIESAKVAALRMAR